MYQNFLPNGSLNTLYQRCDSLGFTLKHLLSKIKLVKIANYFQATLFNNRNKIYFENVILKKNIYREYLNTFKKIRFRLNFFRSKIIVQQRKYNFIFEDSIPLTTSSDS